MRVRVLLPDARSVCLDRVQIDESNRIVRIDIRSIASEGICPKCRLKSRHIHSWYQRQLNDLPWQGLCVKVLWRSRKFFCKTDSCAQKIFTERLPFVAKPHARRTTRLASILRYIAFACGGEEGSRLAKRLSIAVSQDSLLRLIRRTTIPPRPTPRVLGVDDWAFKKGKRYGTILVDLEQGRPVDLLSERNADSLTRWLEDHEGVEIIARDRGDCYIKGATAGAPRAIQVADRFHLVQNLRDALGRMLDRQSKNVFAAVQQSNEAQIKPEPVTHETFIDAENAAVNPIGTRSVAEQKRQQLYDTAMALHQEGLSNRGIALRLGIHRETVGKFIQSDGCPYRNRRRYSSRTDPYSDYLWKRWKEGCRNAQQLTKEIAKLGFTASYSSVRRRVARWRKDSSTTAPPSTESFAKPSTARLSWLLIKEDSTLSPEDRSFKTLLAEHCDGLQPTLRLASDFMNLIRRQTGQSLTTWLKKASNANIAPELQRFANGLKSDLAAVNAAITMRWNNGQSEGQINRLKTLKRQMYGRANFDLLRQRVLYSL